MIDELLDTWLKKVRIMAAPSYYELGYQTAVQDILKDIQRVRSAASKHASKPDVIVRDDAIVEIRRGDVQLIRINEGSELYQLTIGDERFMLEPTAEHGVTWIEICQ